MTDRSCMSLTSRVCPGVGARTPGPAAPADIKFLQGPRPRGIELGSAFRIFREIVYGFRKLHFVGPCVTVFGSARFDEHHRYYAMAREVGRLLAESGFTVMTGGGPGIMEAANRGAKDVGGRSLGCNIVLPKEQKPNRVRRFVDRLRVLLRPQADAGEVQLRVHRLPGGFGTLDELFEVVTLIQTGKLQDFPVALMGTDYWRPLLDQLRLMVAEKTIDPIDLERIIVSDDPGEVVSAVTDTAMKRFGLTYGPTSETAVVAAGDVREVVEAAREIVAKRRNPDEAGSASSGLRSFGFRAIPSGSGSCRRRSASSHPYCTACRRSSRDSAPRPPPPPPSARGRRRWGRTGRRTTCTTRT